MTKKKKKKDSDLPKNREEEAEDEEPRRIRRSKHVKKNHDEEYGEGMHCEQPLAGVRRSWGGDRERF